MVVVLDRDQRILCNVLFGFCGEPFGLCTNLNRGIFGRCIPYVLVWNQCMVYSVQYASATLSLEK